jgi:hypothetical protein
LRRMRYVLWFKLSKNKEVYMWWLRTEFVGVDLEHGNWTSVGHDTYDEAMMWWNATQCRATYVREQTLTDPNGTVVEQRTLTR